MPVRAVLIIDDEGPIREVVRFILEDVGFPVLEARNGREGLDVLRRSDTPLVVLLDLMMPLMSGVELLHAVVAEPTLVSRDEYIIFSTAHAFSASTVRFFLPHKRLFTLPKPFDLDELVAIVEQAALKLDNEAAEREGKTEAGVPVHAPDTEGATGGE